jgi:hypothetical protein
MERENGEIERMEERIDVFAHSLSILSLSILSLSPFSLSPFSLK